MKKIRVYICLVMLAAILGGCNMQSVDELYCLPKRSEAYTNLQNEIDRVMSGLNYSAPTSGENQQTVQMADLDGDGQEEYLLFAKGGSERPMHIFIFAREENEYRLLDHIESTGTTFQQVEYVQMDDRDGMEIVVGRQLSNQLVKSLSVYTLRNGQMEELLKTTYTKFVCPDMDFDETRELLLLHPGESDTDNGVAELYDMRSGLLERTAQANMSEPAANIRRIMVSKLYEGIPAVYVASDAADNGMITDVYALVGGQFTNVTFSNESGTSVQTLRSYYVYAVDFDRDGILELPDLIHVNLPEDEVQQQSQHVIRWYDMCADGSEVDKLYTYHNFSGGWYLQLRNDLAPRTVVIQRGNSFELYLWNEDFTNAEKLLTIHVLTGAKREEQGTINNRFVIHRTETVVYAAELEVASGAYGMSRDGLIGNFHIIVQDWNTGET